MATHARRSPKSAVVILVALAFVATACSSSSKGNTSSSTGSTAPPANNAILGTPNKATGTPIKIGVVDDGNTPTIDDSQMLTTARAVAQYANDYLGGLNGHQIQIDGCSTENTPSGGTTCGVQMIHDKVAAVLDTGIGQAAAFYSAISGSGIPYIAETSAIADVLTKPGSFVFTNPIGSIAAPAAIAQAHSVTRAAFVIIDVPAATGPIEAIAKPIFQNAGVKLDVVPIPPSVADMTPQIEQALSQGDKLFTVIGTDPFDVTAIKALKQLGFTGPIVASIGNPTPQMVASLPGGFAGILSLSSATSDPNDKDVQLYNAIVAKYASGMTKNVSSKSAYQLTLGFIRALTGVTSAVDASSIMAAMSAMPKPVPLPLGGGIQVQCGAKPVPLAPNICTSGVLQSTLNTDGVGQDYKVIDTSQLTKLG